MKRRDVLKALGAAAAGLATGDAQADHKDEPKAAMGPLGMFHAYLCGFHLAKKDPRFVIEAQHYCAPLGDEVNQCVLFDKTGPGARILGVEYIISDRLYRTLPPAEQKYYHPHTYEILAGLLLAPGMPADAETKLMSGLLTTWGKTWHTWPDPKTALPMGEPLLMWSATKDGQVGADLLAARDRELKVLTADLRKRRGFLGPVPQIDAPKTVDDLGRQWTNEGPDVRPQR
jgi:hypothetical protein